MAESFLAITTDKILGQIVSLIRQNIAVPWGLNDDLKKLRNTLNNVKAVILDAEEQQFTSHEVCTWLAQLKQVLFDAEDVFDEFEYEALRKQLVNSPTHGSICKKVRCFLSTSSNPIAFRLKLRLKVREIREAFDDVAANKAKFHLNTHLLAPSKSTPSFSTRELTHSFVNPSQIIGRDKDRDIILRSLLDSNSPSESVSVVSIVGMAGLGKTALAKMVFNHPRVVDHFEKMIWVCLGDLNEFNLNQVMVRLVKSVTGRESVDSDPEQSQSCLRRNLRDRKFLLVLDDVWDVDRAKWLELRELLKCGVNGSKVVVTTRNSSVASNMSSFLTHVLKGLRHDQCLCLFKKFAFDEGEEDQDLMQIGDAIVGKCKGVPLAIKTLGCLLFSKRNVNDWIFIKDSDLWQLEQKNDDILPALKISYNQLPFILKQCFVYCSIFPKDFEFLNSRLIQFWEAHGLLRSSSMNKKVEDIGQRYINELSVRGFFQDFQDFKTFSLFKMHDLIHDLALSVAQNELKNIQTYSQGKHIYKTIRHVSFSRSEGLGGEEVTKLFLRNNFDSRCVKPTIWSVLFDNVGNEVGGFTDELAKTCISELKHTRFMDLNDTVSLKQLPSSIGALKHLRFLNLAGCSNLKRLPNSICQLYNLQTLELDRCIELEGLPKHIGDLLNLKTLNITTKQKRLSSVGEKNGIESLNSLQKLRLRHCGNLEYVFELGGDDERNEKHQHQHQQLLPSLGVLVLSDCNSLTSLLPWNPSNRRVTPRELSNLEEVDIAYCPNLKFDSVFNDHLRFSKLRSLVFEGLPQMEWLPQWISLEGCAGTLEMLRLASCFNLASWPDWVHKLVSLRVLSIRACPNLLSMPEGLGSLTEVRIFNCPELSRRCERGIGEDWDKIKHIPKIMVDGECI